MRNPFHPGEVSVQERVGVAAAARKIGSGIHDVIVPFAQEFVREQQLAVVGAADGAGRMWASALYGAPGFITPLSEDAVAFATVPAAGDPLNAVLIPGAVVGCVVIDFDTRRRMRLNGTVAARTSSGWVLQAREVFGNCPKYIQRRLIEPYTPPPAAQRGRTSTALDAAQSAWIAGADTFFIATVHANAGADASHRGGTPGFVAVRNPTTLRWPDYSGNMMFQTLGNLALDPAAGLLFIDFERGATLQVSGKARVLWDDAARAGVAGAERMIELRIEQIVEQDHNAPRARQLDPSPFLPTSS